MYSKKFLNNKVHVRGFQGECLGTLPGIRKANRRASGNTDTTRLYLPRKEVIQDKQKIVNTDIM